MSLTVSWLMERPDSLDEEVFESWYLDGHANVARRLPGLRRYAVSRLVAEPNPLAASTVFRVAQLCWEDQESADRAFNSIEGLATFGDGTVHAGSAAYVKAMALTHDVQLPVLDRVRFDVVGGRFGGPTGQIVKALAYGSTTVPALVDDYRARYGGLGQHALVREHLLGRREPQPLRPGFLTVPGPADVVADWSQELWFDTVEEAETFLATPQCEAAWRFLSDRSSDVFRGLFVSQELFCSVQAVPFGAVVPA